MTEDHQQPSMECGDRRSAQISSTFSHSPRCSLLLLSFFQLTIELSVQTSWIQCQTSTLLWSHATCAPSTWTTATTSAMRDLRYCHRCLKDWTSPDASVSMMLACRTSHSLDLLSSGCVNAAPFSRLNSFQAQSRSWTSLIALSGLIPAQ